MSATRISRTIPGIRRVLSVGYRAGNRPNGYVLMRPPYQVRRFDRRPFGRDPFVQMEEFMNDMSKKFRRDVDGIFRELPRIMESGVTSRVPEVKPRPRFGEIEDVSTAETYKLAFNFPNAKPEDVKVSLKGHTLTVSGSAEEVTETSKSSRQASVEYELPEDVIVDALESCMSHDGILTVEAPRTITEAPGAPRPINIERE